MNSDEGLPCVNTIEKVYLGLLVTVFALGIISLVRLTYFKAELRKLFDPREGLTIINSGVKSKFNLLVSPWQKTKMVWNWTVGRNWSEKDGRYVWRRLQLRIWSCRWFQMCLRLEWKNYPEGAQIIPRLANRIQARDLRTPIIWLLIDHRLWAIVCD